MKEAWCSEDRRSVSVSRHCKPLFNIAFFFCRHLLSWFLLCRLSSNFPSTLCPSLNHRWYLFSSLSPIISLLCLPPSVSPAAAVLQATYNVSPFAAAPVVASSCLSSCRLSHRYEFSHVLIVVYNAPFHSYASKLGFISALGPSSSCLRHSRHFETYIFDTNKSGSWGCRYTAMSN